MGNKSQVFWLATIFLLTYFLATNSISRAGNAQLAVFGARVPTSVIFPECGIQGSSACEYDIIVFARDTVENLLEGAILPNEKLNLLPVPLIGSVLTRLAGKSDVCVVESLITSLKNSQNKSLELGEKPLATTDKETFTCLSMVRSSGEPTIQTTLLWSAGEIYGWVRCTIEHEFTSVCSLRLYPSDRIILSFPENAPVVNIKFSSIDTQAVEPLLKNLSNIVTRTQQMIQNSNEMYFDEVYTQNILIFDQQTTQILSEYR